jgi:DNA polymerase-3 subunit alpha
MKPNCKYTDEDAAYIKDLFGKDEQAARKKYADVFYYYDGLINTPVSQSQHPAGIVASPINLIEACGMFLGTDKQQILPLDMEDCHSMGLIKYDILGLKTIGVIDKICKMIGKHFPSAHEINFDDQAVYDDMNDNPSTIFQFESSYAGGCFKKMGCHSIDDITLVNAALRPGGASYRDRLFNHEINDNGSKIINDILQESYGFLCYQEEITAFLQYVCGFSGSDADSIRRAIGKKDAAKIEKALPQILEGYCSKSDKPREVAEQEAKNFLKVIEDASEYMFNKNHAVGYSLLSYLCGYYRHYYPVEYCTAYILCAKNQDDFLAGRALANYMNIKIMDIQFRYASWDYRPDAKNRTIYKGLLGVKYMNKKAAEALYSLRNVQFEDFVDLLFQAQQKKVDARQLSILIQLNFFKEFGGISYLLKILEVYKKYKDRKQAATIIRNEIQNFRSRQATDIEAIEYEFDAIGTLSRVCPEMPKSYYFIVGKKGRAGQLYQMPTGKIYNIKFTKKELFDVGMLIKVTSVKQDKRWYKDENGKWQQRKGENENEFEPVIHEFSVLNGKQDEN